MKQSVVFNYLLLVGIVVLLFLYFTKSDNKDVVFALQSEIEGFKQRIDSGRIEYQKIKIVNSKKADSLKQVKARLEVMEESFAYLLIDHNRVLKEIEKIPDTLLLPKLIKQANYYYDFKDTSILVPMPVIRIAVIESFIASLL